MAEVVPSRRSGPGNEERLWLKILHHIAGNICDDWKILGRFLGVAEPQIKNIDGENAKIVDKAFEMLSDWQKLERGDGHDWLDELTTNLGEIRRHDLKLEVENLRKLATTTDVASESGPSGLPSRKGSHTHPTASCDTTRLLVQGSERCCGPLTELQGDDVMPPPEKRMRTSEDWKQRAQEACCLVHERLLRCREFDTYGDQIGGKPKLEMMVSLETVRSAEMDSFRLHQGNEIECHLKRVFSDIKSVELDEIFNKDDVVLVRGLPGSGKSTLCHFILREWHERRLWKDRCYDFIFYVNAPFAVSRLQSGPFTEDHLLKVLYPDVFREIKYDQLHRFKYLIIVDSIDECDVEKICTVSASMSAEDAIKQLIISPEKYDRIVVGRPHACDKVREKLLTNVAFQYVEVVGFSTEQLELYVKKFCELNGKEDAVVWQKFKDNESLFQMVHLPVFANIVCNILREDSSVRIEKQTELYVWTYAVFVTRHFKNHPADVDVSTFEKLFSNEYLLDGLAKVSSMAFSNLTSGKIFFQASDFSFSAIELTLLSPFLVQRQQFLTFAHLTLMEFLAAVHLFITGVKFCDSVIFGDSKILGNDRLRGVLPMYFGLLGSLAEDSDSAKIIKDFTRPLINKFHIKPIDKHPLCAELGKLTYEMLGSNHDLFIYLCFEFGNERLLSDKDFYWNSDGRILVYHHHQLTRLFFLMKNLHADHRRIKVLSIRPRDDHLSINECTQLNHAIVSYGWKVDMLDLWIESLNAEQMQILAPAICLVRGVWDIQASSDECWQMLIRAMEDAEAKKSLQLEKLDVSGCNIDESILAQMRKFVLEVDRSEDEEDSNSEGEEDSAWDIIMEDSASEDEEV